jgi:hypothetical protein
MVRIKILKATLKDSKSRAAKAEAESVTAEAAARTKAAKAVAKAVKVEAAAKAKAVAKAKAATAKMYFHFGLRCTGSSSLTGVPCAIPSVTIPSVLKIGTRGACKSEQAYEYHWVADRAIFMCCKTTSAGLPEEILVIMNEISPAGNWYVAVEGRPGAVFEGRRPAFRTQEDFWRAGWHAWQVNQNEFGGPAHWDTRDHSSLHAQTKVPPDAGPVELLEGLQQLGSHLR